MLNFFRKLLFPRPTFTAYTPSRLTGPRMTDAEIATALQAARESPAFRGVIQILEGYALNAQVMAMWDQRIKDGMSGHYLMAQGYLTDVLDDLADYAKGQQPKRAGEPKGKMGMRPPEVGG
jgi:hypothetical protein